MDNVITTTLKERYDAMRNAAASRGGCLPFPVGELKLTGNTPSGQTMTLSVTAFANWGVPHLELTRGYSAPWNTLTDKEKEDVLDFAEENLSYPNDPEGTLQERLRLRLMNTRFISSHGDLNGKDFTEMAAVRRAIESARNGKQVPLPGDTVEGAYYGGKYPFKKGMLDTPYPWRSPGEADLCAGPYSPYVALTDSRPEGYAFSMSGGPFFKISDDDLEYVGKDRRVFTIWGHEGPCADGCICFEAEVNHWRIKEGTDI